MINTNFIAVDFETATNSRMACQIGIVVVEKGILEDQKKIEELSILLNKSQRISI